MRPAAEYLAMSVELLELADASEPRLARYARYHAEIAARAAIGESEDPEPVERPWCACPTCQGYLFKVRWERMTGGTRET